MTTAKRISPKEQKRIEAITELRKILKPGATVYCVLRHVSRSGMSRGIDFYYLHKGEPFWITAQVGHAIDCPQSLNDWKASKGLRIGGCGMDMGFHCVYSLGRVLFPKGYVPAKTGKSFGRNGTDATDLDTDGGYALNCKWL